MTAKGRERTYTEHYYRARRVAGAARLRGRGVGTRRVSRDPGARRPRAAARARTRSFVANRSFEVYLHQKYGYDEIERGMRVPFFGNRYLLRAEERDEAGNQYALMARGRHSPSAAVRIARCDRRW